MKTKTVPLSFLLLFLLSSFSICINSQTLPCDRALASWRNGTYPNSELMTRYSGGKYSTNDLGRLSSPLSVYEILSYHVIL